MDTMQITLLHHTPLIICSKAIRTCWDSQCKSDGGGALDKDLIYRIGNVKNHKSTLEHLIYTFEIINISRALLQELARHRMASLSVKSTRYTLKELKSIDTFLDKSYEESKKKASRFIVITNDEKINSKNIESLENIRILLNEGYEQDKVKYLLPECYKTRLIWTINARSLQNFLMLRISPRAFDEIRNLASNIFETLPANHKYLFKDIVEK